MKITIQYEFECTDEDIDDIMCTALEGGITYWCDNAKVVGKYLGEYASDQISRGGKLKLHDFEENKWYELTKENFIEGLKQFVLECGFTKDEGNGHCGSVITDDGLLDVSNIDAGDADYIIQCALFGEVVYG
mgnify:CR=1 FL=1